MSTQETDLTTTSTDGGTPASAPEVAAGAELHDPAPAPANESRRDTLLRVAKEAVKPRDERGKFATNGAAPQATAAIEPPTRPAMPKSLKKELESHWNAAPIELASAFVQRESDFEKGVQPLKERARQADELLGEFKSIEQTLRAEGSTPQAVIKNYIQDFQVLRSGTPEQKAQKLVATMQAVGLTLEHLQRVQSGQALPQQSYDPQHINQIVEQRLSAFEQQQLEKQLDQEVQKFAATPGHEDYEAVQEWMASLLVSEKFRAAHSDKSPQEKLEAAYEIAVRMDPDLSQKSVAQQQARERASTQVAQAKKAAVQVRGAPTSGPPAKLNPNDRRGTLSALLSRR